MQHFMRLRFQDEFLYVNWVVRLIRGQWKMSLPLTLSLQQEGITSTINKTVIKRSTGTAKYGEIFIPVKKFVSSLLGITTNGWIFPDFYCNLFLTNNNIWIDIDCLFRFSIKISDSKPKNNNLPFCLVLCFYQNSRGWASNKQVVL